MSFEHRVTTRMAFAARRAELINDWLRSRSVENADGMAHWAKRLTETNDAEMAFARMMERMPELADVLASLEASL